jgi:peptidyl-prolyl cis-trans isomerase SurA
MLVKEVGSENELERLYGMPVRDIKREFEKNIHDGLMVEKLRQKKLSSVKVSKLEVEEFYAENKDQLSNRPETVDLAHILFLVAPAMEADKRARSLIDSIQTILESGANFEELAKKFSQDPGSAKRGGLLGWTKRGDLVPEYEEMAYTLNPGQISPPVRSKFVYHIIRLNERQGEKINTSHILVKLQASSEDKARARAQADSIYNLLLQEGDFAELAKEFSYDKETAPLGGDLGTFPLSELASIYAEKIKAMKVGDFTTPFESQMGIQILKLLNRQTPRPLTLEHDWEQISVMALNWKQEKVYQNWLETLKKDVYIEVKK